MSRRARIDEAIAELRTRHRELRAPLTWRGARAVLNSEGIALAMPRGFSKPAGFLRGRGLGVAIVRGRDMRGERTYFAAHVLGHAVLHAERPWNTALGDPLQEERDAHYFARALIAGPNQA